MSRFGLGRFGRESFRPWVVSANFSESFRPDFFNPILCFISESVFQGYGVGKFVSLFHFKKLSSLMPNHRFKFNFIIFFTNSYYKLNNMHCIYYQHFDKSYIYIWSRACIKQICLLTQLMHSSLTIANCNSEKFLKAK